MPRWWWCIQSDSYLSREYIRKVDATADVKVVAVCSDMEEAKRMMDAKEAYGILYFPSEFSKNIHKGKQATVSLYCDMSALLFYKAFLLATTEVSLEIGKELRAQNNPSSTIEQEKITINPIPYESVALFNSQNGFASFLSAGYPYSGYPADADSGYRYVGRNGTRKEPFPQFGSGKPSF